LKTFTNLEDLFVTKIT